MGRFLADNRRLGQQFRQTFGEDQLGFLVGNRHHIIRRLGVDLMRRKRLVTRHDRAGRRVLHHGQHSGGQGMGQDR